MLSKQEKMKLVEAGAKELSKYKTVGVVPVSKLPDRLLQASKNRMRKDVRFIMGRKSTLVRILESSPETKELAKMIDGTSAIILSNSSPFDIYKHFKEGAIKLAAKPKQIAPEDIEIKAGDTNVQPGQAVTELKAAGIDVQMQKGKVVIGKDKVLVKAGSQIPPAVAKALKTLDIMPFSATLLPSALKEGRLIFTKEVLSIDGAFVSTELSRSVAAAIAVSTKAGIVNRYTIRGLLEKAFFSAIALGTSAKMYDSGIIDRLIGKAALEAGALSGKIGQ